MKEGGVSDCTLLRMGKADGACSEGGSSTGSGGFVVREGQCLVQVLQWKSFGVLDSFARSHYHHSTRL